MRGPQRERTSGPAVRAAERGPVASAGGRNALMRYLGTGEQAAVLGQQPAQAGAGAGGVQEQGLGAGPGLQALLCGRLQERAQVLGSG